MITFFENYHDPILSSNRRKDTWLAWLEKQDGQKPKWKQSDEIRFSQLYDFLVNKTPRLQVDCNEYAAWLNSLKQRMR